MESSVEETRRNKKILFLWNLILFVFNEKSVITVKAPNKNQNICLSTDGDKSLELGENAEIIIRQSKYYAEFIRIKSDEFFNILINKLT